MRHREAKAEVDLATSVASVGLVSPVMTASGTAGHGAELGAYFDLSAIGAVVVKSLAAYAVGGQSEPARLPGAGGHAERGRPAGPRRRGLARATSCPALDASGARVVASIWGRRVEDYAEAAALLADAPACVVAVEVNVSCPNLEDRSRMFAHSPEATARGRGGLGRLRAAPLGQALAQHLRARSPSPRPLSGRAPRR